MWESLRVSCVCLCSCDIQVIVELVRVRVGVCNVRVRVRVRMCVYVSCVRTYISTVHACAYVRSRCAVPRRRILSWVRERVDAVHRGRRLLLPPGGRRRGGRVLPSGIHVRGGVGAARNVPRGVLLPAWEHRRERLQRGRGHVLPRRRRKQHGTALSTRFHVRRRVGATRGRGRGAIRKRQQRDGLVAVHVRRGHLLSARIDDRGLCRLPVGQRLRGGRRDACDLRPWLLLSCPRDERGALCVCRRQLLRRGGCARVVVHAVSYGQQLRWWTRGGRLLRPLERQVLARGCLLVRHWRLSWRVWLCWGRRNAVPTRLLRVRGRHCLLLLL